MKLMLSLNYKFFDVNPKDFMDKILNHENKDVISGFELCIDFDKNYEVNYLKELAYLCKENNFILQLHGDSCYDLDKQYKY